MRACPNSIQSPRLDSHYRNGAAERGADGPTTAFRREVRLELPLPLNLRLSPAHLRIDELFRHLDPLGPGDRGEDEQRARTTLTAIAQLGTDRRGIFPGRSQVLLEGEPLTRDRASQFVDKPVDLLFDQRIGNLDGGFLDGMLHDLVRKLMATSIRRARLQPRQDLFAETFDAVEVGHLLGGGVALGGVFGDRVLHLDGLVENHPLETLHHAAKVTHGTNAGGLVKQVHGLAGTNHALAVFDDDFTGLVFGRGKRAGSEGLKREGKNGNLP